jgi:hypothetical protein
MNPLSTLGAPVALLLNHWQAFRQAYEKAEGFRAVLRGLGRPPARDPEGLSLFLLAVAAATMALAACWAWSGAGRGGSAVWHNPGRRPRQVGRAP